MVMLSALFGLFVAAFVAATVVPFQSEVIFVALQVAGTTDPWVLLSVAAAGNTLGAFVNYALGRGIQRFQNRRWFPVTPAAMARAEGWFQRRGVWTLLLSWAPMGDALTLVAGVMRVPLWQFALLVAIAKTGRYAVLAFATAQVIA